MNSAVTAGAGVLDFLEPLLPFLLFETAPTAVVPKTLLSEALMPAAMALAAAASSAAAMRPGDMSWVAAAPPASAVTVDGLVSGFAGAGVADIGADAEVAADVGAALAALAGTRSSARVNSAMSALTSRIAVCTRAAWLAAV